MERRRLPRVPSDPNRALEVRLGAIDDAWRVDAELVDVNGTGARLTIPETVTVAAAIGGLVTLWIREPTLGIELALEARLVNRRTEEGEHRLGLQFVDLRTVGGLLNPVLGSRFNRRAAFRVTPSRSDGTIGVHLVGPPEVRLPKATGSLVDVSTGGMAIDVPASFEEGLGGREVLQVMFRLPTSFQTVAASAKIVHRTLRPGGEVRYGVQFLNAEEPEFEGARDAILTYVIKRQRESAEENELLTGSGIPAHALRAPR